MELCDVFPLPFAVKVGTVDPKNRLRDISREVAQKAGEMRGTHAPRKDSEWSGQRRPEPHHRGTQRPRRAGVTIQKANRSLLQPLRKGAWGAGGIKA